MTQSKKAEVGAKILPGPFLDFYDPWGNRVEIVGWPTRAWHRTNHL